MIKATDSVVQSISIWKNKSINFITIVIVCSFGGNEKEERREVRWCFSLEIYTVLFILWSIIYLKSNDWQLLNAFKRKFTKYHRSTVNSFHINYFLSSVKVWIHQQQQQQIYILCRWYTQFKMKPVCIIYTSG